jgi:acyl-CoA synthetase (AMP-forming)/AMP-acid ligase II
MTLSTLHPEPTEAPGAAGRAPRLMNAAAVLLDGHDAQHPALLCHCGEALSYGELRDRVARSAACWRAHGVLPGDRVAIKLPDSADWVVAFLASIWCGAIAVGVNPQVPAADWLYILGESDFKLIVVDQAEGELGDDTTPAPWRERLLTRAAWRAELPQHAPLPPQPMDEDAPAVWCHSSGTSGKPKAVVHAHRFARRIEQVSREGLGLRPGDRLFASSRLFFSYPQTNALYAGLKLGADDACWMRSWPSAAERGRHGGGAAPHGAVQRTVAVPQHAARRARAGHRCGGRAAVRVGRRSAAGQPARRLARADRADHRQRLRRIRNAGAGDDRPRQRLRSPRPASTSSRLDDVADAGQPTRLMIRAPTLAMGYFDRPQAQSEHFRDGAFCPADLFAHDPAQRLALCRARGFAGQDPRPLGQPGRARGAHGAPGPRHRRGRGGVRARWRRRRCGGLLLRGQRQRGGGSRRCAPRSRRCRRTSARAGCAASTRCRAPPPASCCGASCRSCTAAKLETMHAAAESPPSAWSEPRRGAGGHAGARAGERAGRARCWRR